MRFRDFVCIAVVAFIVVALIRTSREGLRHAMQSTAQVNRDDANRESTTLLSAETWTEFQIPFGANAVRLFSNCAVNGADAPDHDLDNSRTGWKYALDYELLDADGKVITKSTYHFRSQIRQLLDEETGRPIYSIIFADSPLVATQTRVMQLAIEPTIRPAMKVRVRIGSKDPNIGDIVGRVFARTLREDHDRHFTWSRLSRPNRERMTRFCVYDQGLLTQEERSNLIRYQWTAAANLNEFQQRYLFFLGDIEDQEIRDEQLPAGLYVDTNWRGMIPVPEGKGRLQLQYTWLDSIDPEHHPTADLTWFGIGSSTRGHETHTSQSASSESWIGVDSGLVMIEPSARVVVRAFWHQDGSAEPPTEVTPQQSYIRTYLADQQSVDFELTHLGDQSTPFRLSVRYPHASLFANRSGAESSSTPQLTWEFLDSSDSIVKSGKLAINTTESIYDRFRVAGKSEKMSDPNDYYFAVPPGVRQVRVRSYDSRLLVTGFVRPMRLRRVVRVPEDYHAINRKRATNRTWFVLRPRDADELIQKNRSFIVQTQSRPPEPNESILTGDYTWEQFMPDGDWIGRELLVPKTDELAPNTTVRESAISVTYGELVRGESYSISGHDSAEFSDLIKPRLAFVSDDSPGTVSVYLDEQLVSTHSLSSARGQVTLDALATVDTGNIRIESDNAARFFLAGRNAESTDQFVKRTALRLQDGVMEFHYQKESADDELLTMQLFRKTSDQERCKLMVTIDGPQDDASDTSDLMQPDWRSAWTVRDRVYDLRPHVGHESLLLGRNDRADVGHRCFIRLASDLPPGKYKITVRRIDETKDGFALLYRVAPGQQPMRSVQTQSIVETSDGN